MTCAATLDMPDLNHSTHTLEELVAESERIQLQAANLMEQIAQILQELSDRREMEMQINEGGPPGEES